MSRPDKIRLAMAQINVVVGDLEGNARKIIDWIGKGRDAGADIVTFPELALTGYPPEDLLLKPQFVKANLEALETVAAATEGTTVIVGFVDRRDDIYNAAAILHDGRVAGVYHKTYLPNYGVFDEFRYFHTGKLSPIIQMGEARIGISICEDIWYPDGPVVNQAMGGGAEVLINISSSPYHAGKRSWREQMLRTRAADNAAIVAYSNLVGGQDELVFDGDSMVVDADGNIVARGPQFEEAMVVADLDLNGVFRRRLRDPRRRQQGNGSGSATIVSVPTPSEEKNALGPSSIPPALCEEDEIYRALVLGTRDYVVKNRFEKVVLGLSGGIDSALTAAIAVDALRGENVIGVLMPSQFSSEGSVTDSEVLGESLGIRLITLPISTMVAAYRGGLEETFGDRPPDVAEENIQARVRGNLVMALSNKFGWLVLSTGNKSEISTGYCTLYGDMAGGFAVINDVMKTTVYRLAERLNRNAGSERIPRAIIDKPPSAELRPDQKDIDSLPAYDRLDPVLKAYVEDDRSVEEMVAMGFDPEIVRQVVRLVDMSEYKRRQGAPGIKITPRAFGRDRRMPITNRFRG